MEDMENVLMELSSLEKTPQVATIPPCLDEYLASVASTGKAVFAWTKVKPLFKRKLELIIQEFSDTVKPVESQLEKAIIHGDFNEQNILCRESPEGSGQYR